MTGRPLVYLVDDNELVVAALARRLRHLPILIGALGSASAAIEALAGEAPALVLCDLCLPDGGGELVLREVKRLHPAAGRMLLTGAGAELVDRVLARGLADTAVAKPWSQDELVRLVRHALRLPAPAGQRAVPEVG